MPKVTRKGQVTIPKEIREKLGVKSGSSVRFRVTEGKCVVEKEVREDKLNKWVGYLKRKKRTDELIEEIRGSTKLTTGDEIEDQK